MITLPLLIQLAPSRRLRWLSLAAHALALLAVWLAALEAWPQGLLSGVLLVSALRGLRLEAALELRCKAEGELEIRQADEWHEWRLMQISAASVVLPWLTVLRYRPQDRPSGQRGWQSRVILSDCLAGEDFRRLRVWLKWRAKLAD